MRYVGQEVPARAFDGAFDLGKAEAAIRRASHYGHRSAAAAHALEILQRLRDVCIRAPAVGGDATRISLAWTEGRTRTTLWIGADSARVEIDFADPLQVSEAVRQQMGVAIRAEARRIRDEHEAAAEQQSPPAKRRPAPEPEQKLVEVRCRVCGCLLWRRARKAKAGGNFYCPKHRRSAFLR